MWCSVVCVDVDGGDHLQEVCLGWSMFPVFLSSNKQGGVAMPSFGARKASANSVRLAMYEGTPRALYSLSRPTAGNDQLVYRAFACDVIA